MMEKLKKLISDKTQFFGYMEKRYPFYTGSNIFFRDLLFAIRYYFKLKDVKVSYATAEKLAKEFISYLENNSDLTKVTENAWRVNFTLTENIEEAESPLAEILEK